MNEPSSEYDTASVRERLQRAARYSTRSIELDAIVVRYETQSDRCTITPRECADDNRLTTWLSADVDAFVDLEDAR
ncbi:hypothetical protein HALLA_03490 (plasmid) [Halostagnicola larsenii XH-48]|uniref:DUF7511 domain-containing protein n=1 Tax=Halostagnicola larsenii XH-48 TaxID=797299 RepID=W0JW35_9EURY|nr:hypothetical protein [Halostagnicola larsenii]AHG01465.1 hypothetical protein HALLA_03490 [Halostagnicola larsenii XH-48]